MKNDDAETQNFSHIRNVRLRFYGKKYVAYEDGKTIEE